VQLAGQFSRFRRESNGIPGNLPEDRPQQDARNLKILPLPVVRPTLAVVATVAAGDEIFPTWNAHLARERHGQASALSSETLAGKTGTYSVGATEYFFRESARPLLRDMPDADQGE